MQEAQGRGWTAPDKHVCADCICDDFLKAAIAKNADANDCDYCGQSGDEEIAAPLAVLVELVWKALCHYYTEPNAAGVPWIEGEYVFEPIDVDDALFALGLECEEELFNDIASSFHETNFVKATDGDWARLHNHEVWSLAWSRFCAIVMHQVRYFFATAVEPIEEPDYIGPADFLAELAKIVQRAGMVCSVAKGSLFYRVRPHDGTWAVKEETMMAPDDRRALAGRMNPAGIAYLYLSLHEKTALAEAWKPHHSERDCHIRGPARSANS